MAPRKAELLDLMRKQRAAEQQGSAERTESSPKPAAKIEKPKPAPRSRDKSSPSTKPVRSSSPRKSTTGAAARLPWTGIFLVLLIAIPMVYWLSGVFGGGEDQPGNPDDGAGSLAAAEVSAAEAPAYGVVAIQYDRNPANLEVAKGHGLRLMDLLQTSCDLYEEPREEWIRIYLGSADRAADSGLLDLKERLARLEYPAGSGKFPFASAYIARCPHIPE